MSNAARPTRGLPVGALNCPYCQQPIANERAAEIHLRFEADERRRDARIKEQVDAAMTRQAENHASEIQKVMAESIGKESAARAQGRETALAEVQGLLDAAKTERESVERRLAEAEERHIVAMESSKAAAELATRAAVAEARTALEKDHLGRENGVRAEWAADRQKLADQVADLQRQLKDNDDGERADVDLLDELKEKFSKDEFHPLQESSGATLQQLIRHNDTEAGRILYDTRVRNIWQSSFATKLNRAMRAAKADFAILAATKFPAKFRQITQCEGVIVAHPARIPALVELLRDQIVRMHRERAAESGRRDRTAKIYAYVCSVEFNNILDDLMRSEVKLLQIDEDEHKAHAAVWKKRGELIKTTQRLHGSLRVELERILGEPEEPHEQD